MIAMNKGIAGLALAAGALMPLSAQATAEFNLFGTIGIELDGPQDPGTDATMVFQEFKAYDMTATGGASSGSTTTDFNTFFPNNPQNGGPEVDLSDLDPFENPPRPFLGTFSVNYFGVAPSSVGQGSTLASVGSDVFAEFFPDDATASGAQTYDFESEDESTFELVLSPVIQFPEIDPLALGRTTGTEEGDLLDVSGRYVIDDLSTENPEDLLITVRRVQMGLDAPVTTATFQVGGTGATAIDAIIGDDGIIRDDNGELFRFGIGVAFPPQGGSDLAFGGVKLGFEGSASLRAVPKQPGAEVPVPAALPLLATAMGGLFWMKRRKKA